MRYDEYEDDALSDVTVLTSLFAIGVLALLIVAAFWLTA